MRLRGHMFTSRNTFMYYLCHIYAVLITPPIQLYTQIRIHVFYPGGNLICVATPRTIFMGAKSFISLGPLKFKEILSSTINFLQYAKMDDFQCQPATGFLTMGCTYKIDQIYAVTYSKPLNLVSWKSLDIVLSSYGK